MVAGEVRSLAQRSAQAAREIKGLIDSSVHKVEAGADLVNGAVTQLDAMTRQNAALVQQAASAAAGLDQEANRLIEVTSAFKLSDTIEGLDPDALFSSSADSGSRGPLDEGASPQRASFLRFFKKGPKPESLVLY